MYLKGDYKVFYFSFKLRQSTVYVLYAHMFAQIYRLPQNSENQLLGQHFSTDFFEGLIYGGAYDRRETRV